MKNINLFAGIMILTVLFYVPPSFCQDDGGMLCGGENVKPVWILRWEIVDMDTHLPVSHARVKTLDSEN